MTVCSFSKTSTITSRYLTLRMASSHSPQKHSLSVLRTAHYATIGEVGPDVKTIWLVFHGYGQLSSSFIKAFEPIAGPDTFVLAPEGLSRFYWGGFDGPVVSSWMTRENRLEEIADYSRMISLLYDQYVPLCAPEVKIVVFGFSQGTATAMRWIMRDFPDFHHLMLWAGQLPEDLDYQPALSYFAGKQLHFAYGDEDRFITPERLDFMQKVIEESGLQFSVHPFAGKHRVEEDALKTWWGAQ